MALPTVMLLIAAPALQARAECDPQELAKLLASDAAENSFFGYGVSVSGDTAAIGSRAGAAYVFVNSSGVWTEQARLTASDSSASDDFGPRPSVSGDTIVIGAPGNDHGGQPDAGAAYVFVRSGGVWTEQAKLTASDAAAGDAFGLRAAVSGDTAVIGTPGDDDAGGYDQGCAYVFVRSGGIWAQQAKLTASDAAASDHFGYYVSVFGDTTVIGAYHDDHAGGTDAGSAYVFARSAGVWVQQAKLTASDTAAGDMFGVSVSVSGDTAVVGALFNTHAGGYHGGSAYMFVNSSGVWTEQAKLTASDAAASDLFGASVSVSDDTAVIGAYGDDHAGGTSAGSAYVFVQSGGAWMEQAKLTASDAAADDQFGYFSSVSVSGDTVVVGAWLDDHAGGTDAGSAYVFDLNCSTPGDFDGDQDADLDDFAAFAACLESSSTPPLEPGCAPGDMDGDADVDLADFAEFQAIFMGS